MTVLILAQDFDPTADAVVLALGELGVPVMRTDLAAFPLILKLDARLNAGRWSGRLWNTHHAVELGEIRSIWNRNPRTYRFDPRLSEADQEFCYREARLGFGGVLAPLDVLWANHPNRCADAMFKPYQWKIATECGLPVADTVITNDHGSALRFLYEAPDESAITKALGPAGIAEDGEVKAAFTRALTDSDLADEIGAVIPMPCATS